jgi:hypothetical protein
MLQSSQTSRWWENAPSRWNFTLATGSPEC